jgi:hypothetical protein
MSEQKTISQKHRVSRVSRKEHHVGKGRVSITLNPRRRMLRQFLFSSMDHPIILLSSKKQFPRQL